MPEELLDDSNALGYLRTEHTTIEQLMATCANIPQPDFVNQTLNSLVQELEVHSVLEHEFFFPFMTGYVSDEAIALTTNDDAKLRDLAERLRNMRAEDPEFLTVLDELYTTFAHHQFTEEENLFLPVEGGSPSQHNDLIRLANAMKLKREEMVRNMNRPRPIAATGDRAVTPQEVEQRLAQEKGRGVYPPRDVIAEGDQKALSSGTEDVVTTADGERVDRGSRDLTLDHDMNVSQSDAKRFSTDEEGIASSTFRRERDLTDETPEQRLAERDSLDETIDERRAERETALLPDTMADDEPLLLTDSTDAPVENTQTELVPDAMPDNDPLLLTGSTGTSVQSAQEAESARLESEARQLDDDADVSGP